MVKNEKYVRSYLTDGSQSEPLNFKDIKWSDGAGAEMRFFYIMVAIKDDILLGAIPLEAMDLTINPKRELIGKHGDQIMHKIY